MRIPGGILDHDLRAAGPGDRIVPSGRPLLVQPRESLGNVVDHDHEPVPATRLRRAPVRHRPGGGALRPAQPELEAVTLDDRECRAHARDELEPELVDVEAHGLVGVAHHVANGRHDTSVGRKRAREPSGSRAQRES